jgi:hypothetical protein
VTPDTRDLVPWLRQIGFGMWDPLDLAGDRRDGAAMADEYDGALISAYAAAANGGDVGAVWAVLRQAGVGMGLDDGGPEERRRMVARALLRLASRPVPD